MYRQADGVLSEVIDGRAAVVDREGVELLTLNPSGTMVWEALASPTDVETIVSRLLETYDGVDAYAARRDVELLISELSALGLVVSVTD